MSAIDQLLDNSPRNTFDQRQLAHRTPDKRLNDYETMKQFIPRKLRL